MRSGEGQMLENRNEGRVLDYFQKHIFCLRGLQGHRVH